MFIPHHALIRADDSAPARWLLVLHGIYGSGGNWRTFARKLTRRRPDWGAVLVDLRMHGQSRHAPPPHTVTAAAADLVHLTGALASQGNAVHAVCGHSFGGKVALQYREQADDSLLQTWVIDASPSANTGAMETADNLVIQVLHMLRELPQGFSNRNDFVRQVSDRGFPAPLAHWLAMNLVRGRDPRSYVLGLDLAAMEALILDYYELDCWPAAQTGPGQLCAVVAGKSSAVSPHDRARLETLARPGATAELIDIENSGHWVHMEAPDALLDAIASRLPG